MRWRRSCSTASSPPLGFSDRSAQRSTLCTALHCIVTTLTLCVGHNRCRTVECYLSPRSLRRTASLTSRHGPLHSPLRRALHLMQCPPPPTPAPPIYSFEVAQSSSRCCWPGRPAMSCAVNVSSPSRLAVASWRSNMTVPPPPPLSSFAPAVGVDEDPVRSPPLLAFAPASRPLCIYSLCTACMVAPWVAHVCARA